MTLYKVLIDCYVLCLICFKGIKSSKLYVIDVPYSEEEFLKRYDDYDDPINNIDYNLEQISKPKPLHRLLNIKTLMTNQKHKGILTKCHRVFASAHDTTRQLRLCLESLNNKNAVRQKKRVHKDPTMFSRDYIDVEELGRSLFADDYLDIDYSQLRKFDNVKCEHNDYGEIIHCDPHTRKALKKGDKDLLQVKERASSSDSDEKPKKKYKPKRYQVVSHKKKKKDSDSDEINSDDFKSKHPVKVPEASIESSDTDSDNSIEMTTTTRKPYKNKLKMLENDDKYVYLQGNNYYPIGSFRRRLPHFLPKRYHWREDQYKDLGYYWFNGPRGIPVPPVF